MSVYRIGWWAVVAALGGLGTAVGATSVPPGAIISLALCALVLGPLIGAGIHAQRHPGIGIPPRFLLAVTVAAVIVAVAMTGLIAITGAVAILGVAALAVASPPALRRLRHRAEATPPPQSSVPEPAAAATPPLSFAALTDAELCWRWRTSFAALQHSASDRQRIRLIETRQALLDELATRDPDGFARWMDSGARAASDPTRFLTPHPGKPPRHS